jgi:hypothetical protein
MRRTAWLLVTTFALSVPPAMGQQEAAASALTAAQILQRVDEIYAKARSYRDAGVVEHVFAHGPSKGEPSAVPFGRSVTPFRTAFVRPGSFRFECGPASEDMHGRVFFVRSGADVRAWSEQTRDTQHATTLGAAAIVASIDSFQVSLRIPKLLMPLEVSAAALTSNLAQATRLDDVQSDGLTCFCIKGLLQDDVQRIAECTVWIDQQSFLVRRTEMKANTLGIIDTTTATYEPEIDVEIGAGELVFDPPQDIKPNARDVEAAKVRASKPPSLSEALKLSLMGKHDEALTELDRLWTSEIEPGWEDQPLSPEEEQLVEAIGREAAKDPPTRKHFEDIFDALDTAIRGRQASMHDWARWAAVGRALKLDDRIVQLYVERRSPKGVIRPFEDWNPFVTDTLVDILVDRKQYADAGRLSADPAKQVQGQYQSLQRTMAGLKAETRASSMVKDMQTSLRAEAGRLHALTLAAGRVAEAADVAHSMLLHDDTIEARRELISACLKFGVPCDSFAEWIADIRERGGKVGDLEAKIAAAGASQAGPDGH